MAIHCNWNRLRHDLRVDEGLVQERRFSGNSEDARKETIQGEKINRTGRIPCAIE